MIVTCSEYTVCSFLSLRFVSTIVGRYMMKCVVKMKILSWEIYLSSILLPPPHLKFGYLMYSISGFLKMCSSSSKPRRRMWARGVHGVFHGSFLLVQFNIMQVCLMSYVVPVYQIVIFWKNYERQWHIFNQGAA